MEGTCGAHEKREMGDLLRKTISRVGSHGGIWVTAVLTQAGSMSSGARHVVSRRDPCHAPSDILELSLITDRN